jgi:hypothetical protein
MINRFAVILLLTVISVSSFSQATEPKKWSSARPDIPGTFTVELGINRALSADKDFKLGLWGSRTVNVYYQYDIRILKSRFSLVPGIGLSMERYKFKNSYTPGYAATSSDSIVMYSPTALGFSKLKKSQLVANYLEIPIELKYSTNPEDPARSFKISIGGRVGYLFDSFSKVKYREEGELKKLKNKENFNLTDLRYGVLAKIGVGNFSVFGYYNLTPLFKDGKGLYEAGAAKDFNTFTVGISLASF